MDALDRLDRERRQRNARVVIELSRVCASHNATCSYHPSFGVTCAVQVGMMSARYRWVLGTNQEVLDVVGFDIVQAPLVLERMSRLLDDPGLRPALQLALSRVSADAVKALEAHERLRRIEPGKRYHGD